MKRRDSKAATEEQKLKALNNRKKKSVINFLLLVIIIVVVSGNQQKWEEESSRASPPVTATSPLPKKCVCYLLCFSLYMFYFKFKQIFSFWVVSIFLDSAARLECVFTGSVCNFCICKIRVVPVTVLVLYYQLGKSWFSKESF